MVFWRNASFFLFLTIYVFIILICWETFEPRGIYSWLLLNTFSTKNDKKKVLIYVANSYYGALITEELVFKPCPEVKKILNAYVKTPPLLEKKAFIQDYCRITRNISLAEDADAVLFHNRNFFETTSTLPYLKMIRARKPSAPWIIWSLESPSNDKFPTEKNLFNWTMTYRQDADLHSPYGYLVERGNFENIDFDAIWKIKSKTATWLGSNCGAPNNRFFLIKYMISKGLKADVWGSCGAPAGICEGVEKQEKPCVLELIRPYKFYLAIENSNCVDYVTEKFWKSLDDRWIVPVVLRRDTVRNLGVPDSAYIAVDDFETMREFIDYINEVDGDKELYLRYHQWRRQFKVIFPNGMSGWCTLCERLKSGNFKDSRSKSYENVEKWHSENMCDDKYGNKYLI